ncbi:MAG: hypothetical protein AAF661_16140 [Pseudomonadota bacterium]
MNDEFRGKSLEEVVAKVAARARPSFQSKKNDPCDEIRPERRRLSKELKDVGRDLEKSAGDLEKLRRAYELSRNAAVVAALTTAAVHLATAAKAARIARNALRGRAPSWRQALEMVPVVGGALGSAIAVLEAIRNARGISDELRKIKELEQRQSFIRGLLQDYHYLSEKFGCDRDPDQVHIFN